MARVRVSSKSQTVSAEAPQYNEVVGYVNSKGEVIFNDKLMHFIDALVAAVSEFDSKLTKKD